MSDQLQLSAAVLARWWRPVASTNALDFLQWAMRAVLNRRTAAAIKMASKVGHSFFVVVLFAVALAAAGAIRSEK
jgi:hypothetical protein